jgi:hypothetical protein
VGEKEQVGMWATPDGHGCRSRFNARLGARPRGVPLHGGLPVHLPPPPRGWSGAHHAALEVGPGGPRPMTSSARQLTPRLRYEVLRAARLCTRSVGVDRRAPTGIVPDNCVHASAASALGRAVRASQLSLWHLSMILLLRRRVQPIDAYGQFSGVHRAQDRSFDLSPKLTCAYRVSSHHSGEQRLSSRSKPRSHSQAPPHVLRNACSGTWTRWH